MRGKVEKGGDERGESSASNTLTHTPNPLDFLNKHNMLKLITPWAYHICHLSHSHINDHNTLFDSFEHHFNTLVSDYLALWDDFCLFHILYETFRGYLLAISVFNSWFTRCKHESIYDVIHILYVFKLIMKLISLMMFSLKALIPRQGNHHYKRF